MKNNQVWAAVMLFSVAQFYSCTEGSVQEKEPVITDAEYALRGKYLVDMGGCNDCHTPKKFTANGMELDESRLLSGHPSSEPLPPLDERALQPGNWVYFNGDNTVAVGPWGMTFACNLTPDDTGLKGWEEEVFIKALRTGKHMGVDLGRPIMPPMPWPNLAKASDEDLRSIYKYLRSIRPVSNIVPAPKNPDEVRELIAAEHAG